MTSLPITPEQRKDRARLAAQRRWRPDDPETEEARRDFRVERAEQFINDLVTSAPVPTAEQCQRLARLLYGGAQRQNGGTPDAA